jgi:hypothetical protein
LDRRHQFRRRAFRHGAAARCERYSVSVDERKRPSVGDVVRSRVGAGRGRSLSGEVQPFAAEKYPRIEWDLRSPNPPAELAFAWRTRETPRRTYSKPIYWLGGHVVPLRLDADDGWRGTIIGVALVARGAMPAPLEVRSFTLPSTTAGATLAETFAQWGARFPLKGYAIWFPFDAERAHFMPIAKAMAIASGLAIAVYVGIAYVRTRRVDWRVPWAIFAVAWITFDLRWQVALGREVAAAFAQFGGKTGDEKALAADDAQLVAIALELKRVLPPPPTRVIVLPDSALMALPVTHFLYPLNVWRNALARNEEREYGKPKALGRQAPRSGDHVMLLFYSELRYDAERRELVWPDGGNFPRRSSSRNRKPSLCGSADRCARCSLSKAIAAMRDAIVLVLSIAIPWVAGALCIRAATRSPQPPAIAIGYGYLAAMFGVTLVMRALSLAGIRWGVAWVAAPVVLAALAAYLRMRAVGNARGLMPALGALATLNGAARAVFALLLALTGARVAMLAVEVVLLPLVPFDAFAQWASKSRVWYEYGQLVPFVSAADWWRAAGTMQFTDTHPEYPGTVPLFQVWTALWLGRWDESLINVPWVAAFVALGIACYAQLRRLEFGPVQAMSGTYVVLSLPYLTIQVALAGYADLFVAIAYGLAAIATWQWAITRQPRDAGLAVLTAIVCASVKFEGSLWVLTLVPGVVAALNRRAGLAMTGAAALSLALYLAFGPAELRLLGYTLHTRFVDVSSSVYEHMFVMDNWHLLWYAIVAVVAVRARTLFGETLAPMSLTVLAGLAFVGVRALFQRRVDRRHGTERHQPTPAAHRRSLGVLRCVDPAPEAATGGRRSPVRVASPTCKAPAPAPAGCTPCSERPSASLAPRCTCAARWSWPDSRSSRGRDRVAPARPRATSGVPSPAAPGSSGIATARSAAANPRSP